MIATPRLTESTSCAYEILIHDIVSIFGIDLGY